MQLDNILIIVIVAFALGYLGWTFYKKYKKLSDPEAKTGSCGCSCDHCPFSNQASHGGCCHSNGKKHKKIEVMPLKIRKAKL